MNPSPPGSKFLSGYGIIFAGFSPLLLSISGFANGALAFPVPTILHAASVIFFGVRVFRGHYAATSLFALLVATHYFGVAASNYWYANDFPPESRAAAMAVPRMIRGLLFGTLYLWYYLFRKDTKYGFGVTSDESDGPIRDLPESNVH